MVRVTMRLLHATRPMRWMLRRCLSFFSFLTAAAAGHDAAISARKDEQRGCAGVAGRAKRAAGRRGAARRSTWVTMPMQHRSGRGMASDARAIAQTAEQGGVERCVSHSSLNYNQGTMIHQTSRPKGNNNITSCVEVSGWIKLAEHTIVRVRFHSDRLEIATIKDKETGINVNTHQLANLQPSGADEA